MSAQRPGATTILQAVERRGETDTQPSYFVYAVLPFLLIIGAIVIGVAVFYVALGGDTSDESLGPAMLAAFAAGAVGILAGIVLMVVGLYKVIKRRNEHLARDRLLRQGTLELARDVGARRGGGDDDLEAMERIHNESQLEENERSAALHLILYFLIPFWNYYVLYFLLKDIPRHTRRQARFTRHTRAVVGLGSHDVPTTSPIKEHSFLLALIAMIFIPFWFLVVLYWIYNDPIEHFQAQWAHEDALVALAQSAPAASPGAPDEDAPGPDADDDEAPAFTVWSCPECAKKYKVPPKRPVRVTCKNCGHQEILRS